MEKIKVGIIGTGFGATVHAPIFELHEGFEVRAMTSVYRGKSNEALHNLEVSNLYSSWNEMLENETLDLVAITSTPNLHYEMALTSIHHNIHVLCEKPMGLNSIQTSEMLEAEQRSDVMGFVNFQWRLTPERLKIKEIISNKRLGEIQYIKYQGSFSGYRNLLSQYRGWEGKKQYGGGFLFSVGSHILDSLMWWMNQPITDVYADVKTVVPTYHGTDGMEERDADDAFTIIGHFKNGIPFVVDLFYPAFQGNGFSLEIFGTKGSLIMKNDKEVLISEAGEYQHIKVLEKEIPSRLSSPANLYYKGFYPMVNLIYHSITNKKVSPHIPTFLDGHRVQLVMDAVYKSSTAKSIQYINNI